MNAPAPTQSGVRYRGWLIEESIHGLEATHPDYQPGGDDKRSAFALSLTELTAAVDLWFEDHDA